MAATAGAETFAATGQATETIFRSCPVCEASCGLAIELDRNANRVLSVRGDGEDHRGRCTSKHGLIIVTSARTDADAASA